MSEYEPKPFNREDDKDYVVGFMCMTDFEFELGAASGGNIVYPSVEDLKRRRTCVHSCGIAAVRVSLDHIVQPAKEDYA